MQTRHLGTTGPAAGAIGLGCMGFSQGYGTADDAESVRAIQHALDQGVSLIDTAMSYGSGHNERLVGTAIRGRRDDVVLATKFGIVRTAGGVGLDARPEHVRDFCTASLERLGVDRIDLYYLHRVDPQVPIEETVGAMADLVDEGLVAHLGLSEVSPTQLQRAAAVHPIAAVEFEWSLLWREPERDVVPAARAAGAGLVPYSPLGRGLLTATLDAGTARDAAFRQHDPRFADGHLAANLAVAQAVRELAEARGVTAGQLALAWLLAQGPDVIPIPGSRRPGRIAENAAAAELTLTAQELAGLDRAAAGAAGDRQSFAAHGTARG